MSDMKCPICNKPMKQATYDYDKKDNDDTLYMSIMPCDCLCNFAASKAVWQELIRTRKALDVAVDEITKIKVAAESVGIGFFMTAAIFALEKIKTALEQKESAFVHNKIEFPEFNDNLLEEFDKQFFENGQDDDLTETALEQKEHFADTSKKMEQKDKQ